MFRAMKAQDLAEVLSILESTLTSRFGSSTGEWLCSNWKFFDAQTVSLAQQAKHHTIEQPSLLLNLAKLVKVEQLKDLALVVGTLKKHPGLLLVVEKGKKTIEPCARISFAAFEALLGQLILDNQ